MRTDAAVLPPDAAVFPPNAIVLPPDDAAAAPALTNIALNFSGISSKKREGSSAAPLESRRT
jgi:hypothetical protein